MACPPPGERPVEILICRGAPPPVRASSRVRCALVRCAMSRRPFLASPSRLKRPLYRPGARLHGTHAMLQKLAPAVYLR